MKFTLVPFDVFGLRVELTYQQKYALRKLARVAEWPNPASKRSELKGVLSGVSSFRIVAEVNRLRQTDRSHMRRSIFTRPLCSECGGRLTATFRCAVCT